MTDDQRFERRARIWLEAGPERAPERAVEDALLLIETIDQVRDVPVLGRILAMNRMLALAAAALVVVVGGFALVSRPGPDGSGGQSPAPSVTAAPSAPGSSTIFDSSSIPSGVTVKFTVALPVGWAADSAGPASALEFIYKGSPQLPEAEWWGGGPFEATKAGVVKASDLQAPAITGQARDPFPADLYAWLTALPGVTTVAAPSPVTIDGITGTRFAVTTPKMHPLFFLEGDFSWLGGGSTGLDPKMTRQFTLLTVSGKTLVLEYDDAPDLYAARVAQMDAIFDAITFK